MERRLVVVARVRAAVARSLTDKKRPRRLVLSLLAILIKKSF